MASELFCNSGSRKLDGLDIGTSRSGGGDGKSKEVAMSLTKAEYRVLHALHSRAWSEQTSRNILCLRRDLERRMLSRGLISKRAFHKGYIAATGHGRRCYESVFKMPI